MVAWSLPLALSFPLGNSDLFNYLDLGWMAGHGLSPYEVAMGSTGPYAHRSGSWIGATSGYAPLGILAYVPAALLGTQSIYLAILLARVPALVGIALMWWTLPPWGRWAVCLNPAVLLCYVMGAANDALAIGIGLLGLGIVLRRRTWRSAVAALLLVSVATTTKQFAVLMALPVVMPLIREAWSRAARAAAAVGGGMVSLSCALASLPIVGWITGWGMRWIEGSNVYGYYSFAIYRILHQSVGRPLAHWLPRLGYLTFWEMLSWVCMLLAATLLGLWFVLRSDLRPRTGLLVTAGWYAIYFAFAPGVYGWYLIPIVALAGLAAGRVGIGMIIVCAVWMIGLGSPLISLPLSPLLLVAISYVAWRSSATLPAPA